MARVRKLRTFMIDDILFFIAVAAFVSGTAITYVCVPYIYLIEDVAASLRTPPTNFITQVVEDERLEDAASVLLGTAIISVKLSFLFFFRPLLRQQKKLMIWWWCTVIMIVLTAPIMVFGNFISCDYFDQRIICWYSLPRRTV